MILFPNCLLCFTQASSKTLSMYHSWEKMSVCATVQICQQSPHKRQGPGRAQLLTQAPHQFPLNTPGLPFLSQKAFDDWVCKAWKSDESDFLRGCVGIRIDGAAELGPYFLL